MTKAEAILADYFLSELYDHVRNSGCNDMTPEVFSKMEPWRASVLLTDFRKWDKSANQEGYKPRKLIDIPDYLWVGFLRSRLGL